MVRTPSEKAVLRRSKMDFPDIGFVPCPTRRMSKHNVFSQSARSPGIVAPAAAACVSIPFARNERTVVPGHARQAH